MQYSATSVLYGATLLPYFLNESQDWGLEVGNLAGQIEHVSAHCSPPGGPNALTCETTTHRAPFACL